VLELTEETLALENAVLRARVEDLEIDKAALRVTLRQTVEGLHVVTAERDKLKAEIRQLRARHLELATAAEIVSREAA
jgi:hypothetical protein